MSAAGRYPSYRAPQANREILCVPPWKSLHSSLTNNSVRQQGDSVEIAGTSLEELARDARVALVEQAQRYTRSYSDVDSSILADSPLILAGHQPELVHPGVWLKNFAAAQLASEVGGTAISLIIDSDLCRTASIRVPTGTVDQPRVVSVPLDEPQLEQPYEQRAIADRRVWSSFGERVYRTIQPLVSEPMIAEWWPAVVAGATATPQLGLAIAQARHQLEQRWGSRSLEIPQSLVCDTEPFQRFALHLIFNAEQLRHDYNGALAQYREMHHLRNAAQPLPDLMLDEDWVETPFWIWSDSQPARRALFVKPCVEGWKLSDRQHWQGTLPKRQDTALQQLTDWRQAGIKVRSRALITTLYARLLLSDTFFHGIGGAKYDEVTDALCERVFGLRPPGFVTLSGTLRLPIEHATVSASLESELQQRLRQLRYHPERFVTALDVSDEEQSQINRWVSQKNHWVQTNKTASNAKERHNQITTANEALQPWLRGHVEATQQQLERSVVHARSVQVLDSREYPFCLFPRELLRDFLLDFSASIP